MIPKKEKEGHVVRLRMGGIIQNGTPINCDIECLGKVILRGCDFTNNAKWFQGEEKQNEA